MNFFQAVDLVTIMGIAGIITALLLLIYSTRKTPKGILCSECGNRRVALTSKKPTRLMTGDFVGNEGGYSTAQVRYILTYKCPDCFAENTFESGFDD